MRYTGPKNRIARRENMDLGMKTPGSKSQASLLKRINVLPGQHGAKNRRKKSEHSRQLREKQKLRYSFGVTEKQLKKYFGVASRKRGNTAVFLCELLERRLDNVVYRLGFAPTRAAARQLVSHGHFRVNDKKMTIASYSLKESEQITFAAATSMAIPYIDIYRQQNETILPEWLEVKKNVGIMTGNPDSSLIEKQVNLRLVVEFYSR
jgi:small subunit ribosomal protein S4